MKIIYEKQIDTAKDFINELRLSSNSWLMQSGASHQWGRDYIFRGERSVEWKPLMPKAWRTGKAMPSELVIEKDWKRLTEVIDKRLPENVPDRDETIRRMKKTVLQNRAELVLIVQFHNLANELGFNVARLPRWAYHYQYVEDFVDFVFPTDNSGSTSKYPDFVLAEYDKGAEIWNNPIVALAQHHGVPTRLLDWTNNPLVAALFAAIKADTTKENDRIAIYSASLQQFWETRIKVVEVPSADNPFLRAQSGIFTLDTGADDYNLRKDKYPSFEDSVNDLPKNQQRAIFMISLPVTQVPELLRLLWLERITQAHLMPTLDNVAETIRTRIKTEIIINDAKPWKGVDIE